MAEGKAMPIALGRAPSPRLGPRSFTDDVFDFSLGDTINISINLPDIGLDIVQTLFIDNSLNVDSVSFFVAGSTERISCPPYSQGFFPVLSFPPNFSMTGKTAGGVKVPVQYLNLYMPLTVWSVQAPGAVVGTVTVAGTVTANPGVGTFTARNKVLAAAGVSQELVAANGTRKRLFIQNPFTDAGQNIAAAESIFISFGAAAGIENGSSIEIPPGGSFDTGNGPCTTQQVQFIAATQNHRVIAWEM